jgi:hypothetical protein
MHSGCTSDASGISEGALPFLQQYLTKLFSRQLPYAAVHLQGKERSQNFAGIQPRRFDQVVDVACFLGAE